MNNQVKFKKGELCHHPYATKLFENMLFKVKRKNVFLIPDRFRKPVEFYAALNQSERYIK